MDWSDDTDTGIEIINGLYATLKKKVEVIPIGKPHIVVNTRWFTVYSIYDDGLNECVWTVWKYNHLFKHLEPLFLARKYKFYPHKIDIFRTQVHSRGIFKAGMV